MHKRPPPNAQRPTPTAARPSQEATRAKLEQERLASELEVARSRIDQSAEALRSELRRMEEVAEETAQAQAQWRREAQRRQAQLEEANAQLSQSAADAHNKLQTAMTPTPGISESIDAELSATLDELHGVKTQLEVERQHNYSAQLEKRNLTTELSSYKAAAEDESRRAARALAEAQVLGTVSSSARNRPSARCARFDPPPRLRASRARPAVRCPTRTPSRAHYSHPTFPDEPTNQPTSRPTDLPTYQPTNRSGRRRQGACGAGGADAAARGGGQGEHGGRV